ncbi:DUF2125 domain-containing protein [Thalassobius sp. S69A]|uniref:DUF2125 domain-containing protein n=1 Tax=unclassified Thalassovita TaxID=2619711 RepID=UPI003C79A04A
MKHWTLLNTSAATALCLTGSAAFADVTAQDVWGSWKEQMEQFGYSVSADESMSGGTLTLSNIVMNVVIPEDEGKVTLELGTMSFAENGDGTVDMIIPAALPMKAKVDVENDDDVEFILNLTSAGMKNTISGTPDNMTFTYKADSLGVEMTNLTVEGEAIDLGAAKLEMTGVSGLSNTVEGAVKTAKQSFAAQSLNYLLDMADPDGKEGRVFLKGALSGLSSDGASSMPEGVDMQDMNAALKAGFGFNGGFTHTGGQTEFTFTSPEDQFSGSTSTTGGAFGIAMDAGQLVYELASQGLAVDMSGSDIPLPVSFRMQQAAMKLMMPLAKSDALQDYQISLTLGDFTMADLLWGIFDPTQQLPRDPATIDVDLTGQVKLTHDLMDEKAMAQLGGTPPGELHATNINTLTVRAAGAELTGNGGFTFDNTDLTSFDGMPRPEGTLNLKLIGGNGLLDKLVAMGFVPEDQAMGARMMMGLFAVPGAGEDTLTSTIEVNEQGHVLANGQRLK